MSAYLIISIFLVFLFCCILDFIPIRNKKYIYIINILALIIISSLKTEDTSSDTYNYVLSFHSAVDINSFFSIPIFRYEPGYVLLEIIIKSITDNVNVLFFIISIISLSLLGKIIWQYSPYPFLSIFIYVCMFYFKRDIITIRYGISCVFMLMAIVSLYNNSNKKFILWSMVSFMFHYTAFSVILFYVYYYFFENRIKDVQIVLLILFVFSILGITILSIIKVLPNFLPPFFAYAITKGLSHLGNEVSVGFKQIVPYLPFCLIVNKLRIYRIDKIKVLYLTFLFSILMMIELNQSATFSRVNQMYLTIIVLFFPFLINYIKKKNNFLVVYSLIMVFSIYMFVRISFFNSGGFINVYW